MGRPEIPGSPSGDSIQLPPARTARARTVNASISSATTITLNSKTSFIRVTALTKGIYLRYQAGVDATNFDEYIPADTTFDYIVPPGVTAISVIERAASATVIVIEK